MSVTVFVAEQMEVLIAIFRGFGASEQDSYIQADLLTEADLRGVHTHGLQRLPVLFQRIRNGVLKVDPEPARTWTTDAVLCVDGKDGLGPPIVERCLGELAPAARRHGVAALAMRNVSHLGMMGYYCRRRAEEGLICIGFTSSEALVHPYGGAEGLLGTNPIAIGIPGGSGPFVFDMATSLVSMGRVIAHHQRGELLGEGWAIDRDGKPTTDPEAAMGGAISPLAGAKGYGLGLSIGLLTSLLPGAQIGKSVRGTLDVDQPSNKGDLFLLVDPRGFVGGAGLAAGVDAYLDILRASTPMPGFDRVSVPGDRSEAVRRERLASGIPHPEDLWSAALSFRAAAIR